MSIHVKHEFIPKLIRKKVDAAIKNREAFIADKIEDLIVAMLANRNAFLAKRAHWKRWIYWSYYRGEVLSVEETAKLVETRFGRLSSLAKYGCLNVHDLDPYVYGPQHMRVYNTIKEIEEGAETFVHVYRLQNNLEKSSTRRVWISANVLSSITYWATQDKH